MATEAEIYRDLTQRLGEPTERRVQAAATAPQRAQLGKLSPAQFPHTELAGEKIGRFCSRGVTLEFGTPSWLPRPAFGAKLIGT